MATRKKQELQEQIEETRELDHDDRFEGAIAEAEGVPLEVDEFEEFDGEEEIVPGGPTYDQIEAWKSKFQDKVFLTEIEGDVYIWRPIRRIEYKNLMKAQKGNDSQQARFHLEERICDTCILYPANFRATGMSSGLAGVPSLLSEMVLNKSGFTPTIQAMPL